MTEDNSLWLGSEESLLRVLHAQRYALTHPDKVGAHAGMRGSDPFGEKGDGDEEDETRFESYLIQVEGDVGIINIMGPMVAEDSWINYLFGLVSYLEISRALKELVESEEIVTILLNMDTGGGSAAGLEAASDTLTWARKFKDVNTHTSGAMLSAGFWLGVNTKRISSTKMAESGSVGVVIVHRSVYQYLQEAGIEYTVIRAGKYKALGHPSEKLSKEAEGILQEKADTLYHFFLEHVSTNRAALSIATKDSWAEGLTFFGEEALRLGLVDEITTLSRRVEKLDTIDKQHQQTNNTYDGYSTEEHEGMAKSKQPVVLRSDKDKAALASGLPVEGLDLVNQDPKLEDPKPGDPKLEDPKPGDPKPAASEDGGVVAFLKEQNTELAGKVAELTLAAQSAEAELIALRTDIEGLRGIAMHSMHNMQIVLNAEPTDLAGLPAATVVAQHAKVRASFEERFKAGQQSKPVTDADAQEDDQSPALRLGIVRKS